MWHYYDSKTTYYHTRVTMPDRELRIRHQLLLFPQRLIRVSEKDIQNMTFDLVRRIEVVQVHTQLVVWFNFFNPKAWNA